jgi:hypothetical protein
MDASTTVDASRNPAFMTSSSFVMNQTLHSCFDEVVNQRLSMGVAKNLSYQKETKEKLNKSYHTSKSVGRTRPVMLSPRHQLLIKTK